MTTKVITGKVRASYVNVFKPKLNDLSGREEYSMQLIIDKSDQVTISKINKAISAAVDKKWPNKAPANLRLPLRDADLEAEEKGEPVKPHLAGCYFMNVKSYDAPGVVDKLRMDIIDAQEFQSGDYCRVSINASCYDQKGNRGVSFWLQNVQVLAKGDPLGSKARAEDDFDDYADDEEDWAA